MAETWKSPATVLAIAGLVISLGGNIYQFHSTERALEHERTTQAEKHKLDQEGWEFQRQKLQYELDQLRSNKENREELLAELGIVKKKIRDLENAIAKAEVILSNWENELLTLSGEEEKAQVQSIQKRKELIQNMKNDLTEDKKRRQEIESKL